MSEKSRDEKLAAGKKKLKKFQEITSKLKDNEKNSQSNFKNKKISHNSEFIYSTKTENNDKENQKYSENLISGIPSFPLEEPTGTTETIKQISRHLNGIISCSNSSLDRESQQEYLSTIYELEKRNVELANLNSNKVEQMELFNSKIGSLHATIDRITKEFENEKLYLENSCKKQIESYKTQLQSQVHTISLLIAEKSELQSQVSHNQKLANQRFQEIDDFTNKLKASRQKVGDLEKSVSELKHANEKYEEAMSDILRQLEQTRNEIKKVKSEKEDLFSENSQLKSKLISKTQEISDMELTFDDLKSELEIAQVQIQHLTNNQEGHYDNLCSKLKITEQNNIDLKGNIESLKSNLQQSELQNIRLQNQYRCYIEETEEKLKNYQSQFFEALETKNDTLQIENGKNQSTGNVSYYENIIHELENVKQCLTKKTESLESHNVDLKEKNACLLNKNEKLIKNIEELEIKNEGLIERTNQFELNQMDYNQLLNQVQSDKTALSRALTQNKQLKSQLIELQEAFVKLSSDNMDYSTQLQHEKYISKELATRLGEQEDELTDIRRTLSAKDEDVSKSNHSIHRLTEELLTFSSNLENDSLQRSESHFNMANKVFIENLQNDLLNSQERINQLTTENNNLQYELNQNIKRFMINKSEVSFDNIDNLMLTLRQLKAERDQLLTKCEILGTKENGIPGEKDNLLTVSKSEYQALKGFNDKICEELENISIKNSRLMQDNQHLEHIIEQLEGETDTIGEYIYLYQHQRSLLKQKCHSRDQLMSKLIHHKQFIDHKLLIVENLFKSLFQPAMKDDNRINLITSTYDRILKIIHEVQNSSGMLSEFQISSFTNMENKSDFFSNSMLSDDLFQYRIIHCKCCIGKIIDL